MVFNTFSFGPLNQAASVEAYIEPVFITLIFVAGMQIKFCLLGEGDLEENQRDIFDQRAMMYNIQRGNTQNLYFNTQRNLLTYYARLRGGQ